MYTCAQHLLAEFREENKQALLNVISDSITGVLLFTILALNNDGRKVLYWCFKVHSTLTVLGTCNPSAQGSAA